MYYILLNHNILLRLEISLLIWNTNINKNFIRQNEYSLFSSFQSLSRVWYFATPWTAARQASLSITNSQSPPKPISIVSVMPSNHLILCHPLLLLPSVFPSIRISSNESSLHIRWPNIVVSTSASVLLILRTDFL